MTIISTHKVIKVNCKVENTPAEIILDSCASVNIIIETVLRKFNITKEPIGKITEKIFQVYSNNSISSNFYELNISIGGFTFKYYFRKIDKDNIFDILFCLDILKKNRFFSAW